MTLTGSVAGNMSVIPGITCHLYEGNITRSTSETRKGLDTVSIIRESSLKPGDKVELFDDQLFDYHALGGLPIVRKVSGQISPAYVGEVISQPDRPPAIPQTNGTVDDLSTMISHNYLRCATVEFPCLAKIAPAEIVIPGEEPAYELEVGNPAQLGYVAAEEFFYLDPDNGGQGVISLHHIVGEADDTIGIALLAYGMTPIKVI